MNEMNETPAEVAGFITKRMWKEVKKWKTTGPHPAYKCRDKRCVWHHREGKR
jgi:hypothetical protein